MSDVGASKLFILFFFSSHRRRPNHIIKLLSHQCTNYPWTSTGIYSLLDITCTTIRSFVLVVSFSFDPAFCSHGWPPVWSRVLLVAY